MSAGLGVVFLDLGVKDQAWDNSASTGLLTGRGRARADARRHAGDAEWNRSGGVGLAPPAGTRPDGQARRHPHKHGRHNFATAHTRSETIIGRSGFQICFAHQARYGMVKAPAAGRPRARSGPSVSSRWRTAAPISRHGFQKGAAHDRLRQAAVKQNFSLPLDQRLDLRLPLLGPDKSRRAQHGQDFLRTRRAVQQFFQRAARRNAFAAFAGKDQQAARFAKSAPRRSCP